MLDPLAKEHQGGLRSQLTVIAVAGLVGLGLTLGGCAHPYSGKPQRVPKERKKKRPKKKDDEATAAVEWDEKCRTNFFEKPTKRRRPRSGKAKARGANNLLLSAEDKEGADRVRLVDDAISKLRNSLKDDPYGPLATYKLAVAYALVAKKGCALELLKRLQALTNHPDVEAEARRTVKRAANDMAFDPFRKEANAALGE